MTKLYRLYKIEINNTNYIFWGCGKNAAEYIGQLVHAHWCSIMLWCHSVNELQLLTVSYQSFIHEYLFYHSSCVTIDCVLFFLAILPQ